MWLPIDTQKGQLENGVWVVTFGGYNTARIIQSVSLTGPSSSSVVMYLDTVFMDVTARGDFNRADYYAGIPMAAGRQLNLIWSVGTGTAPVASIACTDGQFGTDQRGIPAQAM
jgi:hypothetical protein